MNVKKISDDVKTKEWMIKISACRESGLTVKQWCKENNVSEPTYYKWLKKLRTIAVESGIVEVPSFVPIPIDSKPIKNSKLTISINDIYMDIPADTDINTIFFGFHNKE